MPAGFSIEVINISSTTLKIIALITMIMDHVVVVFFNDNIFMRAIGRISFPLYIITFADGYIKTSNRKAFFKRVFVMACISQPFYLLNFSSYFHSVKNLNILFTFLVAFAALMAGDNLHSIKSKGMDKLLIYFVAVVLGDVLRLDYGSIGIASIILAVEMARSQKFGNSKLKYIFPVLIEMLSVLTAWKSHLLVLLAGHIAALVIAVMYNSEYGFSSKNRLLKNFLSISYPLHLALIFATKIILL